MPVAENYVRSIGAIYGWDRPRGETTTSLLMFMASAYPELLTGLMGKSTEKRLPYPLQLRIYSFSTGKVPLLDLDKI